MPTGDATPAASDCPSAGTARAVHAERVAGIGHPVAILYGRVERSQSGPSLAAIVRYELVSGATTEIVRARALAEVQLSPDGRWLLYRSTVYAGATPMRSELRLVRADGRDPTVLYCVAPTPSASEPLTALLWSPDQRAVAFQVRAGVSATIYLLNLVDGTVRELLRSPAEVDAYTPTAWLDATHLYVARHDTGPPYALYLLDTSRGADQSPSVLRLVAQPACAAAYQTGSNGSFKQWAGPPCWSVAPSLDASRLYLVLRPDPARHLAGRVVWLPPTGGVETPLLTSETLPVASVHPLAGGAGLLLATPTGDLWRADANGSHLSRLATGFGADAGVFGWAALSPDQSLLITGALDPSGALTLRYGPLAGGPVTHFATVPYGAPPAPDILDIGWATR